MSTDIILHKLVPQSAANEQEGLAHLVAIASALIPGRSPLIDSANALIALQLDGGLAELHSEFAIFSISNIGEPEARLMFELARIEDMVILTEDGVRSVIVVSPDQVTRLPKEWLRERAEIQMCDDAATLLKVLRTRLAPQEQLRQAMEDSRAHDRLRRRYIPGICDSQTSGRAIYVESFGESVTKHQEKVYRCYQRSKTRNPASGIMMAEFWNLETPEGHTFYAYGYGGDFPEWEGVFRDFAAEEKRLLGHVEDNLFFVQSDGRRFPLAECRSAKMDIGNEGIEGKPQSPDQI